MRFPLRFGGVWIDGMAMILRKVCRRERFYFFAVICCFQQFGEVLLGVLGSDLHEDDFSAGVRPAVLLDCLQVFRARLRPVMSSSHARTNTRRLNLSIDKMFEKCSPRRRMAKPLPE